jgi:hypothetical protein
MTCADYFNYGFNEVTWSAYCDRQRRMRVNEAGVGLHVAGPPPRAPPPDLRRPPGTALVLFKKNLLLFGNFYLCPCSAPLFLSGDWDVFNDD